MRICQVNANFQSTEKALWSPWTWQTLNRDKDGEGAGGGGGLSLVIPIRQDLVNIILLFQIVRVQKVIHFTTVQLKIGIICLKKLKTIQDNKKFELKKFLQLHNQYKDENVYIYYKLMDTVASMQV